MVKFIEDHPVVAGNLKSIDMKTKTVYFSDNCEASIGRSAIKRAFALVGSEPH